MLKYYLSIENYKKKLTFNSQRVVTSDQECKVCKLKSFINGLKQSSRQWYLRSHEVEMSFRFSMTEEDHCVYIKRPEGNFVILSLSMDDILLTVN